MNQLCSTDLIKIELFARALWVLDVLTVNHCIELCDSLYGETDD